MDFITFFSGIGATLIGVIATVLATQKIESIKQIIENEKIMNSFYIEMDDLRVHCHKDIKIIREAYFRIEKLNKNMCQEDNITGITFPRPPMLTLLYSILDKSFYLLNAEQRESIRTIIFISKKLESQLDKLCIETDPENLSALKSKDLKFCLSCLSVLYHLSLCIVQEKERFNGINKEPDELLDDVLSSLGLKIGFQDLITHKVTL